MVYVLDINGQPLMPTDRHGKVKWLLRTHKAKVVKKCPFTIQLKYESTTYTQPITLGVDAGSKSIGLSATTKSKELYASEVVLRNDIVKLLSTRRQYRKSRRARLRHRKARFDNRVHSKHKGWLAPSIEQKINTHMMAVDRVCKILPITNIVVETASFDIQKIKNPNIGGVEYQQGDQLHFWNVREYVFFRDGYKCKCCKGKSKDKILNVHHIQSRKTGGNAPDNLVTLCETCHKSYHKGAIVLPSTIKRGISFKDATFMGIMRWTFYNRLKRLYPNVHMTFGYITKNTRISHGLEKTRLVDARCISGNPLAASLNNYYYQVKKRCHNRQIHKAKILKGGIRKRNQAEYKVFGYRLFDKVKYQNNTYFIFGRRSSGRFDIRTLQGGKVNNGSISYKDLTFIAPRATTLIETYAV